MPWKFGGKNPGAQQPSLRSEYSTYNQSHYTVFSSVYILNKYSIIITNLSGTRVRKMCLNARCRVFLCALTSDLNSWGKILPKNVLTHPKQTTGTRVRKSVLKCVLMRVAAFFCARWPQIWTPEEKYYQKMSSHTQIGQLGPKLGKKCLKMCLNARCRVFLRVPTSDLSSSAKVLPENVLKHPIYTAQTWETVLTFRWARIFKRNHSAYKCNFVIRKKN